MSCDINLFLSLIFYELLLIVSIFLFKAFDYKFNLFMDIRKHINSNCYYYCFYDNKKFYKNIYK